MYCILIIFKLPKFCEKILKINNTELNTNNISMMFFLNIEKLLKIINNVWIIVISICLTITYWYTSHFFQCGRITSHLSLIYFETVDIYLQTAIAAMFIVFDTIIGYQLFVKKSNADDSNISSVIDKVYDDIARNGKFHDPDVDTSDYDNSFN